MPANPDFRDRFSMFNAERVEYLVVGAHAVIYFTEPRYTKDLDVWVNPSAENAERVHRALARFGAPLAGIAPGDFADPGLVYQIGVPPNRIDVVMGVAGLKFRNAWAGRVRSTYDGIPVSIVGKESLMRAKRAAGRRQDLLDLEKLAEHSPRPRRRRR
jgi:hypothetical protein